MNVSEKTLLIQLSAIIDFAHSLPLELITDRSTKPIYPVTLGEQLVSYALGLVVSHEWKSDKLENLSDSLETWLIQLDTGVDQPDAWHELFEANVKVKRHFK